MEAELIAWLRSRLPLHPQLLLGIGDDGAILRLASNANCVLTTDMLNEGIDFRLGEVDARRVGRKALAVNLSDLAAMAARPLAAVVSLALPRSGGFQLAQELYEGLLPLAVEFDLAIAGGDTNAWDGPLAISIAAIGETTKSGPLTRHGALPGDQIVATGQFGGSILGKHFDFEPRVREALLLHERYTLHAGIDVSDGLSLDLARLCAESRCGAVLEAPCIPIAPAAEQLARQNNGSSGLDHALGDGEDFELLLAIPPADCERMLIDKPIATKLTRIGRFVAEPGLWLETSCERRPLVPRGFKHRFD